MSTGPDPLPGWGLAKTSGPPADVTTLDLPVMLLHDQALRNNIQVMADYCRGRGVSLAPHAKTSMAPYVVRLQMEAGAWGQTAATMAQVKLLRNMGVRQVMLGNVLVESSGATWVAERLLSDDADGEFLCYVDSAEGVDILERTISRYPPRRRLGILVELGFLGGRTGVRTGDDALRLARLVARSRWLELRGLAGFEGLMPRSGREIPPGMHSFLAMMRTTVQRCWDDSLFDSRPIVTAGGSSYFDLVVQHLGPAAFDFDVHTVLRAGCYATHDHGMYRDSSPLDGRAPAGTPRHLEPALELVAAVWSRPEPELVIAGFGRRHVPTDERMPVVLGALDAAGRVQPVEAEVVGVNDQHAFLRVGPDCPLRVGDLLSVGISHPCGAFDRWRQLLLVSRGRNVLGVVKPQL